MRLIKAFFRRITKDFRQKELLPLKLLFFVHASTLYVLYPYLTIHMRELGINVEETAIMSAITPIVSIVMPPLAGMIADKIGNFRILLALFSSLGGASALLLLLVPVGRITLTLPPENILALGCNMTSMYDNHLGITMKNNFPCKAFHPTQLKIDARIQACGFSCPAQNSDVMSVIEDSIRYHININDSTNNKSEEYVYIPTNTKTPIKEKIEDQRNHKILENDDNYMTSIRKLEENRYFFPASSYSLDCNRENDNSSCNFGVFVNNTHTEMYMKMWLNILNNTDDFIQLGNYKVSYLDAENSTVKEPFKNKAMCHNQLQQDHRAVAVTVFDDDDDEASIKGTILNNCAPVCIMTAPRAQICSNDKHELELDMKLTFWTYLAVRVFIGMIGGTAFAMFEGAVIAILREQKGDYGLQRIYATIGGMISSPLSGIMIDYASKGKGYTDFRPAFYLYAALKIASGVLMLSMNLEFKSPANNVITDVLEVLKNIELIALFIACFILGTAWGYIESFLFWLLQDLGGSRSLMGVTITVGGIAGIPLLVLSGPIIHRIGHANVLFIGFIFYAIRLLGYSLIYNPWLCLIFEAMESVTSSLAFTAAVTYAAKLSTTTTDTSIQGLLGGLYFGVGKGAGSLIGGYLMKTVGTRPTYQIFAAVTAITGCMYFLFNKFYLSRLPQTEGNEICKKKPKKVKEIVNVDVIEKVPVNEMQNGKLTEKEIVKKLDQNINSGYETTEDDESKKGKDVVVNMGDKSFNDSNEVESDVTVEKESSSFENIVCNTGDETESKDTKTKEDKGKD